MKEAFNKTTNSVIVSSILACIMGITMIATPDLSIKTIGLIAASYIILHGIILIVVDLQVSRLYIPFDGLLSGIVSILLGSILICKPDVLPVVFTFAIGVWFALSSMNTIKMALTLKDTNIPWLQLLLLGILDLLASIIVIFNPFAASLGVTVFVGIMIIVHSAANIADMIIIKKDVKEFEKAIKEKIKTAK